MTRTVGVDIGGTKIAAGLVDAGAVVRILRRPTPAEGAAAVLDTVAAMLCELAEPFSAIGVGSPGIVRDGTVVSATEVVPGWAGAPVRDRLSEQFGVPVVVDNDVRAMAYGESRQSTGRGDGLVLYVAVGTGLGGALTRDGALVHGQHGSAGEVAHLLTPTRGAKPCGCGRLDHLEAVSAGPAIAAAYAARAAGEPVSLPEVATRMRAGDPLAGSVVTEAGHTMGRVLGGFVTAADIDAVVLGGGAALGLGGPLVHAVAEALHAEVRPQGRPLPVRSALLGPEAPVIGAALLALQEGTVRCD
ncbi:ROK family protein [Amycolatopsis benzoatilytica]|uniref:ROK family protein n=1 Tax=Amycolatopsis benzoatilytica TaxID=346045 RepID=UPI00037EC333|nr:ROK family protein [Amycolatopsis benzoatilytica]